MTTLKELVQKIIEKKNASGASFSSWEIHNAAKVIVNAVNVYMPFLEGKQVEDVDGILTQRIGACEVKSIVRELTDTGYDSTVFYTANGAYVSYTKKKQVQAPAVNTLTVTPTGNVSTQPSSVFDSDFENKLINYLKKVEVATVKEIQSRFKGVSFTCAEFLNFAQNKQGLYLFDTLLTPSKVSVSLV